MKLTLPVSKTIREEFSGSTILTIAHRIHTIVSGPTYLARALHSRQDELMNHKIDFDKVLVMDKGAIAEFASPAELLRNHKSKFYAVSPLIHVPPSLGSFSLTWTMKCNVECTRVLTLISCVKLQVGPSSRTLRRWR